jgi:hypothetical protein
VANRVDSNTIRVKTISHTISSGYMITALNRVPALEAQQRGLMVWLMVFTLIPSG